MLYINARTENAKEVSAFRVEDEKFVEMGPNLTPKEGEEVVDLHGKLVLPPFIEPHVHLDSALTAGNPRWNIKGTLFEGIQIWSEYKPTLTKKNIKERVHEAIRRQAANGIQFVRTHVDCTDPTLIATEAILEVKEEVKDWVEVQLVAFPQEGICSFPNGKQLLENAIRLGVDAVGAIPHFEFTHEYAVASLHIAMELAEKYDRLVDVHCDEIDDPASRGLETLAMLALESGLKERVTASHTTAMHSYNNAYCQRLFRLLGMSDINFIANPLINTHLQGRIDTYPKRRGITRVPELLANGNNVAFGHDDIQDPWYPMGDGNSLDVVHLGLHVTQMMGYEQILNSYRFVTHNAARCLHLQDRYGLEVGKPANFIVLNAENFYDALNLRAEVLLSVHRGRKIAETKPKEKSVLF